MTATASKIPPIAATAYIHAGVGSEVEYIITHHLYSTAYCMNFEKNIFLYISNSFVFERYAWLFYHS